MSWCEGERRGLGVRAGPQRAFTAPDQETDEAGAAAFRQDRQGGAGVRRFPLPHARELAAGAARGGQGGVSGEGRKPALRGDVIDGRAGGCATALRDDPTAPAERWRTASRSSSWGCSRTAPRPRYCGRIRSDYIFLRSATACWKRCGGWGWRGRRWRGAQCTTIRLRLLKIGARIRITARKVWISLATGYAWAGVFEQVYENLARGEPLRC